MNQSTRFNSELIDQTREIDQSYIDTDNIKRVEAIARKVYEINPEFFNYLENHPEVVTKVENFNICIDSPFPPPPIMEQYEKIYSGASKIIFDEYQRNAHHHREKELTVLLSDIESTKHIQILAFTAGFVALVAGSVSTVLNYPILGAVMGGGGVIAMMCAVIFSYVKSKNRLQSM